MKAPTSRAKQTKQGGVATPSEPTESYVRISPEGYVEVIAIGDQTPQSIEKIAKDASEIVQKTTGGNPKYSRQLVDISRIGKYSAESNKAAMKAMEFLEYDRVALFGGNHIINDVMNMVIMVMGKGGHLKTFDNRDEAIAWLTEPQPPIGK